MTVPAAYGRRLIPNIVDERARVNPEQVVYSLSFASTSTPLDLEDTASYGNANSVQGSPHHVSQQFRDVSARTFANAVDRVAWWLESKLGKGSSFPSIGWIGPRGSLLPKQSPEDALAESAIDDIRYALVTLGCIKAGYKAVIISPRNSVEADLAVLEAIDCNIWVLPKEQPKFLPQLLAQRPMEVLTIAEVDELLQDEPVPKYAYNKTFDEASSEPFCVLHTSGSTGHPKPIVWKHSMLATLDATRLLPEHSGRPPWVVVFDEGDRFYSSFPFYHSAGMVMNVLINAFYGTCNVLGPAHVPPTLALIESLLDHAKIKIWSIIPSVVDDIGESAAIHKKFKNAKVIIASGGPVRYESAKKATQSVRVLNITGTAEGIFMGSLLVEREDWIYLSFHPYANFDFREIEPGVFEQCIVRDESKVDLFQGIFHTFPDITEMSLKDLYSQHPTKPGLWLYKGRTDDMVVLSNGNKIHPKDVEAVISSHPAVSACLIIGTGHYQAALLVELVDSQPKSTEDYQALLDDIYRVVKRTNASKPSFAAIIREYIMFAKSDKPFSRTDKGTVKRRSTVMLYEKEIEEFYEKLDSGDASSFSTSIDATSPESAAQDIQRVIMQSLSSDEEVGLDDDIFAAGLDSVQSIRLVRCLGSAAEKYNIDKVKKSAFVPHLVYSNPTINQLSTAFYKIVHCVEGSPKDRAEEQAETMRELLAKYTANLPRPSDKQSHLLPKDGNTVILTGSTGSLGSYILESLLRQANVIKIYCLNRVANGMKKQSQVNKPRGLTTDWSAHRVQFLQADFSKPNFALDDEQYSTLIQQTTHIIHSQWPVNFNLSISSLEPHIRGVRHLIDFCLSSKLAPTFFFVSTLAAVSHLKNRANIPEVPMDILPSLNSGYAASKQVCELILQHAYERSGLNAVICRIRQVAGPVLTPQGMWPKQEWVPTIIASSKYLGLVPSTLGYSDLINWIPVDILGNIIVELAAVAELRQGSKNDFHEIDVEPDETVPVFHAVNPEFSMWADLLPTVQNSLAGSSMRVVTWGEWVDALSESQHATTSVEQNPGLKLLDFFESLKCDADAALTLSRPDTDRAEMKSGILAGLKPVGAAWMEIWLKQWAF